MNKPCSGLFAVSLVLTTLVWPDALLARGKRGAEVVITLKDVPERIRTSGLRLCCALLAMI